MGQHHYFAMSLIDHPRIILDYIDKVTPKQELYHERTALFYAAESPDHEILLRMLELGANVFYTDTDGSLPVHFARDDTQRDSLYFSMRDPLFPCMQCRTLLWRSVLYGPRSYYRCLKCLRKNQITKMIARGFAKTERKEGPWQKTPFLPPEAIEMILVYHIENIKADQEREIQYEIDHGLLLSPTATEMKPRK